MKQVSCSSGDIFQQILLTDSSKLSLEERVRVDTWPQTDNLSLKVVSGGPGACIKGSKYKSSCHDEYIVRSQVHYFELNK